MDRVAGRVMSWLSILSATIVFLMLGGLVFKAIPILESQSLGELLLASQWKPMKGEFGFYPFVFSTLMVTFLALVIAIPVCILAAIYLAEYASRRMRKSIVPFIDILAGIPSVIFGIWGVVVVVPAIRNVIAPMFGFESTGYCILAGSIVLSIMVFPIIINLLYEVLKTVPQNLRDASLSLGANKWETIKWVVLRKAKPGLVAAIVLGFSRAFGETISVLMVVGNVPKLPH